MRETFEGLGLLQVGILCLLFGVFVGGVGCASAGMGIGIPMIPLGLLLVSYGTFKVFVGMRSRSRRER